MDVALQVQDATAVRVAVRVRPLITRELLQGSKTCISTDGPCVTVGRDRRFTFDHAFGPSTQQEQVYGEVVSPLVESCFDGFNVTVLAYGQTGSGKTFTMGTGECEEAVQQMGIAPRVIRHVFEGIEARKHVASFQVRAQFLEIYNEDVKDLLVPPAEQATKWISREREQVQGPAPSGGGAAGGGGGSGITLRDAGDGTILVVGAVEAAAQCAEDLEELLERGLALRATSSTCANEQSSRSHAILTIIIEQHLQPSHQPQQAETHGSAGGFVDGGAAASTISGMSEPGRDRLSTDGAAPLPALEIRTAKLHLVDLAGSERTKQLRTSMQGTRFRETVNINQGLLALGNVISALGDERRRGSHVPYRESKLTRLLQDSLGGNSRTAMIACVSPADDVLEETLNTLKYANRAKNIRNKPVVNRALPASTGGAVQQMQLQVLQQLVAQLPDGELARGLPLAELLALDATDPAACLDVLGRMRSALAASGVSSRATSMDGSQVAGMLGRQLLLGSVASPSNRAGGAGAASAAASEVEVLVSGCSRAIAGILHGLAEMEAQGQIKREAREHILRSLDASTLRLLPVVRSMCPRGNQVSAPGAPPALAAAAVAAAVEAVSREEGSHQPRAAAVGRGTDPGDVGSEPSSDQSPGPSDREWELEERVRFLETELSNCQEELREAQEDLERDEIIFADKMKELQEIQSSSADLKQRLQDAEERHAKEVDELRRQVEALQVNEGQLTTAAGRPARWVPSRNVSRNRLRRGSGSGSGSGYLGALRRKAGVVPFTMLRVGAADGEASAAAPEEASSCGTAGDGCAGGAVDDAGGDADGERAAEEDEVLYDEELLSYISETDYTEQHRREVLESDVALREELAEVLREKAAAEAERAALERAALAQRSSFDDARAALEQQLSWLSGNINVQQQQLQAAQAAEREARELAAKWQERAQELEAAIEAREEALQRLRSELEAVEGNAMRSAEERAVLRQQYEQRIAAVVAQVSALQRQLQQHASAAAVADRRERQQSAERAAALEAELTRMRSQQADLKRQLSERVSRYERESAARLKDLASLRKAAASARSRMSTLEQENRAQRLLLRAKQQEVMAVEQRLRDSQRGGGGGSARSRSSSPGCRGYLGRGGSASGGNNSVPSTSSGEACNQAKSPSPGRGQVPQSQPQRPWGLRSSSLQRLEDIAAEELQPLRRSASNNNNANNCSSSSNTPRCRQGRPQQSQQGQRQHEAVSPALEPGERAELEEWSGQLLGLVSELAGVEARVEVLSSRHRELLSRRELLLREQSQFSLRARRRAEQVQQAVVACEAELADLAARAAAAASPRRPQAQDSLEEADKKADSGAASGGEAAEGQEAEDAETGQQQAWQHRKQLLENVGEGGDGHPQQATALQQRMADVREARDLLQERVRSGRLLDEREQQILDSLDDQLDDLETQLSYVAGELADRRAALSQLQRRREQLQQRSSSLGAAGLQLALAAATEAVGHRAYQVRQLEAALAASEAGAARREAQLQCRLRESLVSLSAHLASLEAASPKSSGVMESSELRNLLGIYLDLDANPTAGLSIPSSGAGPRSGLSPVPRLGQHQHVRARATKHSHSAVLRCGTQPMTSAGTGATAAVGGMQGSEAGGAGASGPEEPELPQAESLAVWGSRPWLDGAASARRDSNCQQLSSANQHHDLQQQQQLDPPTSARIDRNSPDLSLQAMKPSTPDDAEETWPRSNDIGHPYSQQHQRAAHQPDVLEHSAPVLGITRALARENGLAYGATLLDSLSSGGDSEASASEAATDASSGPSNQQQRHRQQQQSLPGHRSSGSGSQVGGAPPSPTGGILRRAGSMDSVGSAAGVSSGTKRVTWSAHITTGPSKSATAPPQSPTLGGSAATGGVAGRGKERSILDRAGTAMWARGPAVRRVSFGSIAGSIAEAPPLGAVHAADVVEGFAAPARRDYRHEAMCMDASETDPVVILANADGSKAGGAYDAGARTCGEALAARADTDDGGVPAAAPPPRSSYTSLSRSSVDTDDTVAASDAGAGPEDAVADETGLKTSVRSFNPWRGLVGSSPAPKQPQPQARTATDIRERPHQLQQGHAPPGDPEGQGTASYTSPRRAPGGGGSGRGGEDDLLLTQSSYEMLVKSEVAQVIGDTTTAGGRVDLQCIGTTPRQVLEPAGEEAAATAASRNGSNSDEARTVGAVRAYDSGDDELDEHVRLLEQAASALAAPRQQTVQLDAHTPFRATVAVAAAGLAAVATTSPGGWGADTGPRSPAAATDAPFGYSVVFDDDPDSHVYFFSNEPTPREPAGVGAGGSASVGVASASKSATRQRFSLDRPAPTGSGHGSESGSRLRANTSAPLPLPAPARSSSPVQHQYGRLQRQKPWVAPAPAVPAAMGPATTPTPGPFTTPKPLGAMTALSEALLPYKAHLKRSAVAGGRGAGAGGGGSGAMSGRTDTAEGRRLAAPVGIKASQKPPHQPHQRYLEANMWSAGSEDVKVASSAFAQRQPAQQPKQQPWRTFGPG